jgi:hypothetical protein
MPVRGLSRRASAGRAGTALTSAGSAASSGTTRGVPTGRVAPGRSMAAGAGRRWRQLATSVLTGRAPSVRAVGFAASGFEPPPRGRPSAAKGTGCASPPTRLVPSLWMAGNTTSYNQRDAPLNSVNPVKTKRRMCVDPARTGVPPHTRKRSGVAPPSDSSAAGRQTSVSPGHPGNGQATEVVRRWSDLTLREVRFHQRRGEHPSLRSRQVPRWSCTQRPASSRRERSRRPRPAGHRSGSIRRAEGSSRPSRPRHILVDERHPSGVPPERHGRAVEVELFGSRGPLPAGHRHTCRLYAGLGGHGLVGHHASFRCATCVARSIGRKASNPGV